MNNLFGQLTNSWQGFFEELLLLGAVLSDASQGTLATNKPTRKLAILMRTMRRRLKAPLVMNYYFK